MKNINQTSGEGMTEDPGAIENRLTVNPEDFPNILDWQDGRTYKITELGAKQIRQISPGEFEVIAPMPEPEEPMPEEEEEAPRKRKYRNPAVENLIRKKA